MCIVRPGAPLDRGVEASTPRPRGALLLALVLLVGCHRDAPRVASAILITLDTTRADAVSFEDPEGLTPQLAELAPESVVYRRARTVAPLTLPAHASMLTGLWPPRHLVRDNGRDPLPASAVTLAERASAAGLETAAFLAAVVLDARFGLDQGFEVYDAPFSNERGGPVRTTAAVARRSGEEVVDAALAWLDARDAERPFLLWVHLYDPHAPYRPPADCLRRAGGHPYHGEVAALDRAVGRLIDELRARGYLDRALLMIVGDHGESLGEHDEPTHANYCYEATLRIPFLIRHPSGYREGEVSDELVSAVDVEPTIAAALGLEPSEVVVDGLDLLGGRVSPDRGIYFESYYGYLNYGWSPLAGWVDAEGKYLHSSTPELYDPEIDPAEEHNLIATHESEAARYRAAIAEALSAPTLSRDASEVEGEDLLEPLRALGYTGAPTSTESLPAPLAPSERKSPLTGRAELRSFYRSLAFGEVGRLDEAIRGLEQVVAGNPEHLLARDYLAAWLVIRGRDAEAWVHLEYLVEAGATTAITHNNLGNVLERAGDPTGALDHYRRARDLDPGRLPTLHNLARVLEGQGLVGEAAEVRAEIERLTRE